MKRIPSIVYWVEKKNWTNRKKRGGKFGGDIRRGSFMEGLGGEVI